MSLQADFGLVTMSLVGEEEVPLMACCGFRRPVAHRHALAEVSQRFETELGHSDVFLQVELDANVPIGENRRRLAIGGIAFHHRDPDRWLEIFEVIRRGRPHDAASDDHDVVTHR